MPSYIGSQIGCRSQPVTPSFLLSIYMDQNLMYPVMDLLFDTMHMTAENRKDIIHSMSCSVVFFENLRCYMNKLKRLQFLRLVALIVYTAFHNVLITQPCNIAKVHSCREIGESDKSLVRSRYSVVWPSAISRSISHWVLSLSIACLRVLFTIYQLETAKRGVALSPLWPPCCRWLWRWRTVYRCCCPCSHADAGAIPTVWFQRCPPPVSSDWTSGLCIEQRIEIHRNIQRFQLLDFLVVFLDFGG